MIYVLLLDLLPMLTLDAQLYLKSTLTSHTKAMNAFAISPHGAMLLSGGELCTSIQFATDSSVRQ